MSLAGKRVLITSGPTRGHIDAVRYITTASTGRLGSLIAREALRRRAYVTFIYGKGSATPESCGLSHQELERLARKEIDTVKDLAVTLKLELSSGGYDVMVHAMAVLDYVPARTFAEKVRSGKDEWTIKLVRTPKVIAMAKEIDPDIFLVGFKLEVDKEKAELVRRAHEALKRYAADLFVTNDLSQIRRGEHIAYLVDPAGEVVGEGRKKEEIACRLIDVVEELMGEDRKGGSDARQ